MIDVEEEFNFTTNNSKLQHYSFGQDGTAGGLLVRENVVISDRSLRPVSLNTK